MRRLLKASCLAAFVLLAASCDQGGTGVDTTGMSKVSVFLGDAPGAVKSVWLKIDQIYLIDIDGATSGHIVNLLSAPTGLIEVTSLVDTVKALALAVPVEPGQYNELRFIIGGAVLQSKEGRVYTFGDVTPPNGLVATGELQCPSCAQSGIRVVLNAQLAQGSDDLVLDFDVDQSFGHEAGHSGRWIMHPILRALHRRHGDGQDQGDDQNDDENGDRFASIAGTVALGGSPAATIPQCPAGHPRSLEDFVPTATADTLKNADGSALVAAGRTDAHGEFRIGRLKADGWKLGYKTETIVSDAGHKLKFVASVTPQDTTVAAGEQITGVKYTITSVSCAEPTP